MQTDLTRRCSQPLTGGLQVNYWETIADNLSASGWTWGCLSHIDLAGRVLFTADAHRDNGKRFIVNADEKLTAFLELERVTHDDRD